jgi:hypothetical protein
MKLKPTLIAITGLLAGALTSNAAQFSLFNVQGGPGVDTLFANVDGSLMDGSGFVTMGYFGPTITVADIDTAEELVAQLVGFTAVQTAVPGTSSAFTAAGYLAEDPTVVPIVTGNPLIGRVIYAIASDVANLASVVETSGLALFQVATILDDNPVEQSYVANPAGVTPIIGELGTFNGDLGLGDGEYTTLKLVAVPEPSAALLGALGALGLLRRRRI